ncbi:MAG: methyltransferase domain-containing protein [Chloroflexota bacterium]|nr:methyltransferase domain-containing protein [Chloroflexota bacterium]
MVERRKSAPAQPYLLECLPGLTEFVEAELNEFIELGRLEADQIARHGAHDLVCTTRSAETLLHLRTVQSVYSLVEFAVPRPKALLGDQHFRRLREQLEGVVASQPRGSFTSFHLAAAGSDSTVMTRLKAALSEALALPVDEDSGDLLLRVRKAPDNDAVWESLVRLTPRPSATRYWRVCDMVGALNATVAHVMSRLAAPDAGVLCNLTSGSGTIAIEHTIKRPDAQAIAIDLDPETIACALQNAAASRTLDAITFILANAATLPAASASFDALCADLPFGQRVGSHNANITLYPRLLREAARIAKPGATFVILTHEIRLIETFIAQQTSWRVEREIPITLRGLHPRIYVLRRQLNYDFSQSSS